jgi:hypothetical protein
MKKSIPADGPEFFTQFACLCGADCFCGTNISTGTTIDAFVGIYFIDVAFRDCFGRTFWETSTTSGALITNYISHIGKFKC